MNGKIILWSIALFFGCSILFRAVADATVGSSKGVALAVQAGVLVLVVAIVVGVVKRRS
ncbi:MAG TPA: hypothetical protein VGO81_16890 [Solirubrobacteraceae bacterium]|nr:hypothetical protein [Solirubrobacteraceae bacterium]